LDTFFLKRLTTKVEGIFLFSAMHVADLTGEIA
jgi:hypothetical protein